ncbi:ead/Ea22-like family protein [Escherichia coli]|nr:ead/Ea22-like family protein [Escherichia coli]EFE9867723.1 ead/Ea22-like family protein [Escherichia coli]
MTQINYQALREKAEKATKGSYIVGHTSVNQHGNLTGVFVCQKWKGEPGGVIAECHVNCLIESDAQAYANAEFIAEANPATVLALLDEQERNLQYIKSRDQENEDIALTVGKLRVELEETKSKLNEQREYYEGVISDGSKRIAELESDSQEQKLVEAIIVAIENEQERLFDEDYLMDSKECIDVIREEVKRWNDSRAAGIRIKGE